MKGNVYGYMRVSSTDQNEDRQRIAMQQKNFAQKRSAIDKEARRRASFLIFSYNLMTISDICSKGLGNHFLIRYNKSN